MHEIPFVKDKREKGQEEMVATMRITNVKTGSQTGSCMKPIRRWSITTAPISKLLAVFCALPQGKKVHIHTQHLGRYKH